MVTAQAQTYLLIDGANAIVNGVLWDGNADTWTPPAGLRAVRSDAVWQDGWRWDASRAVAYDPNPPPPAPPPKDVPSAPPQPGMDVL